MNKLKRYRIAAGLTQQFVAISLGIKPPSVNNWESGKSKPRTEKLKALAELYGVSVDDLLWEENQTPAAQKSTSEVVSPSGETAQFSEARRKLLELFETIPEDQLEKAYQIVAIACGDEKNKK